MKLPLFTVDAFTEEPFAGNPAAVIPLDHGQSMPELMMQRIAFEMNLSETAFLTPKNSGPFAECDRFGLRWFTPTNEVPLCGHATLASAHVLFYLLGSKSNKLEFETLSGILEAEKQDGGITLNFPVNPTEELTNFQKKTYLPLANYLVGDKLKEIMLSPTTGKLLIRMDDSCSREDLEAINPNKDHLLKFSDGTEVRGVIVTLQGGLHRNTDHAQGIKDFNFISRYFAPWVGIPEDPVTGAAHTVLVDYWSKELGLKELKCRQCSPRGGNLLLTLRDDGRVNINGKGTTVIQGHINV